MSEHISSQFDNDILQINVKLTKMGGICEDNLKKAIKAITKNDSVLAEYIIKKDQELDDLENAIDDLVIKTIALRQPVADDLRLLFAAIKISTAYQFLRQYTDHKYAKVIDILSKEFFLSEQGIKNILQKMKRK